MCVIAQLCAPSTLEYWHVQIGARTVWRHLERGVLTVPCWNIVGFTRTHFPVQAHVPSEWYLGLELIAEILFHLEAFWAHFSKTLLGVLEQAKQAGCM